MTPAWNQPGRDNQGAFARLWLRLGAAHDLMFSTANKTALKHLATNLSIAGFVFHLLLVFLARSLAHPPLLLPLKTRRRSKSDIHQRLLTRPSRPPGDGDAGNTLQVGNKVDLIEARAS